MASNQSSKNTHLVARIPWLPLQTNGTHKLEDTQFYKDLCDNGSERGMFRQKLYQFYNDTTPFYLPLGYYNMDCFGIQKNSNDGQYWANATHFMFCSEVHAQSFFFKNIYNDLIENKYPCDKLVTAFNSTMKSSLLKETAAGSVEEFLLSPWVLIQVPFRPAVLHQWAVALLAEALKFQLQISDLLVIDTPNNYRPLVEKLINMCNVMHRSAQAALDYFSRCCLDHWAPKVETKLYQMFPYLLPVLRFVLSDKCNNVVRSIKRLSWNASNTKRCCRFRPIKDIGRVRTADPANLYTQSFWLAKRQPLGLFSYPEQLIHGLSWQMVMSKNSAKCDRGQLKTLSKLVLEKIIKPGRLGGVANRMIYAAIDNSYAMLYKVYDFYRFYLETSSEAKISSTDEKYGLIFDIISLYSDVRVAEALDYMVIILYSEIADTYGNMANALYINAVDAQGPKMSLAAIKSAVYGVKSSNADSYESLLMQVKNACFNPDRVIFLDYESGPEKVAQHFQERIRIIAFTMIEKQCASVKSPCALEYITNPELSTVMLLLPCFVASFLDLCSEEDENHVTKENYMMVVHRLIYSYERIAVAQKQFQSYENLSLFHMSTPELEMVFRGLVFKLNQALQSLLSNSKIRHEISTKCLNYLLSCNAGQKQGKNSHWQQIDCVWYSQMLMFWNRILESFLDVGLMKLQMDEGLICTHFLSLSTEFVVEVDASRVNLHEHIQFRSGPFPFYDENQCIDLLELLGLLRAPPELRNAAQHLSLQQLIGLFIYFIMKDFATQNAKLNGRQFFPVDDYGKLASALIENDRWKVKMRMASKRNQVEDFSLISYRNAKNNLYYKEVLQSLTPSGTVAMMSPGEVTFCPIKHCRWCGQVNAKQFRVCPECKDNLDYPDLNFFCSESCEKQCLEKQHIEEHARNFMMLIGLVN